MVDKTCRAQPGEKHSLNWLISPYFELREKFNENIYFSLKMSQNFSLSESSSLSPKLFLTYANKKRRGSADACNRTLGSVRLASVPTTLTLKASSYLANKVSMSKIAKGHYSVEFYENRLYSDLKTTCI